MFCGDVTYGEAGATSCFRGNRAYGGDADSGKGIRYVELERLGALDQCAHRVCAGEQEPIESAQIAKRLIQRCKIRWWVKRNHGLEHGFGAASFQFANERLGLI